MSAAAVASPGRITCAEVAASCSRYLDGALAPERSAALELHAEGCARCGELLRVETAGRDLLEDALAGFRPGKTSVFQAVRDLPKTPDSRHALPGSVCVTLILGAIVFFGVSSVYLLPPVLVQPEARLPMLALLLVNFGSAILACGLILGAGRLIDFEDSMVLRLVREATESRATRWSLETVFGLLLVFLLYWFFVPGLGWPGAGRGEAFLGALPPLELFAGLLGTVVLGGFAFALLARVAREPGRTVGAEIVLLQVAGLIVLGAAGLTHYCVLARWVELINY